MSNEGHDNQNASSASSETATDRILLKHCLDKGVNVIPDKDGNWYPLEFICSLIGYEKKTVQNHLSEKRTANQPVPERHPARPSFYRMQNFNEVYFHEKEVPKKKSKKSKKKTKR